jgi:hypothetical protein
MALMAATGGSHALACTCASGFHRKDAWDLAKQETAGSTAIFEGPPERFDVKWSVWNAKVGELVPIEDSTDRRDDGPRMVVIFQVQRAYRGEVGEEVQVETGLGGGDCGAIFSPGLTYLVFATESDAKILDVNMCSPGGWVGSTSAQTQLRYLRKDRPLNDDLAAIGGCSEKGYAAQEARRQLGYEEDAKRYAAATGEVCGKVIWEKTKEEGAGIVAFLPTIGFSPVSHPTASIQPDGTFGSGPLGPGTYRLYFTRRSASNVTSAVYYPGGSRERESQDH